MKNRLYISLALLLTVSTTMLTWHQLTARKNEPMEAQEQVQGGNANLEINDEFQPLTLDSWALIPVLFQLPLKAECSRLHINSHLNTTPTVQEKLYLLFKQLKISFE